MNEEDNILYFNLDEVRDLHNQDPGLPNNSLSESVFDNQATKIQERKPFNQSMASLRNCYNNYYNTIEL